MRAVAVALLLTLGVFASESALAQKRGWNISSGVKQSSGSAGQPRSAGHPRSGGHHHHGHKTFVGVGFGFAYPWGWWYPPPYPYYLPVAYPAQSVTYIEQAGAPAPAQPAWWYYCEASTSYYPQVRECPTGWVRVPASPPTN